jgi:hypothetical protein
MRNKDNVRADSALSPQMSADKSSPRPVHFTGPDSRHRHFALAHPKYRMQMKQSADHCRGFVDKPALV